ncbi:glycine cleavage system protein GcvH [Telmatospirillum siberiense]|uniref:Glycine cleavage system H protein n=1 Tax=Telmatospirillum siberiense TaxID=382514 RepID=A0A2N3PTM2_9PROT|nr:glycine cleavage system protein GcvH [Telmatospirillum siberiense]PKU23752.1 glycine cleavage system protein H [Telmatospirillum siberiense]
MSTYFTKEHEWVRVTGTEGVVGITDYAQHALGDVVFVELPEVGKLLTKGGEAAVVESVKAASEVFSPVSGEVLTINATVVDQPALINDSPEDGAWFFSVRLTNPAELDGLMDRAAYDAFVKSLE